MTTILLSIAAGIGLSAACGFRIFLPFAILSAAAFFGDFGMDEGAIGALLGSVHLQDDYAWVGTGWALALFSTATAVEIVAYYVPWLDNLLDTIATPLAMVAGVAVSMMVLGDMPPAVAWTAMAIAGGTAGTVQTGSVATRALSSVGTGGLGNFAVATAEFFGALVMTLLATLAPIIGLFVVLVLLMMVIQLVFRRRRLQAVGSDS